MSDKIGKKRADGTYPRRPKAPSNYFERVATMWNKPPISYDESWQSMNLPPRNDMDAGLMQQYLEHGNGPKEAKHKSFIRTAADYFNDNVYDTRSWTDNTRKFLGLAGDPREDLFPDVYGDARIKMDKAVRSNGYYVQQYGDYPSDKLYTATTTESGSPFRSTRPVTQLERERINKNNPNSVFNKYLHRAAAYRSAERRGEPRPGKEYAPGYKKGGILYRK